jgi:2-amino-4-hydroxy-6-hydroxymethyldihydropteridine diphosphokinase
VSAARTGYIGLGSNVGERREQLQRALDGLAEAGVRVVACSSVYDTDPVGEILDQPSFLNACARVESRLDPEPLLDLCKTLERQLGRSEGPRHAPRAIDIDLLLLGDLRYESERLRLPHEQVLNRRFVLIPLLELDFDLTVPGGRRLADALLELPLTEGVRLAGPPLRVAR